MPSSLFYGDKKLEISDAKLWMKNIASASQEKISRDQIILTWRQNDSFVRGSQLYTLVDNRLVPDAAFMIGALEENKKWIRSDIKRVDIIFLLRTDKESKFIKERSEKSLRSILDEHDETKALEFRLVDWWDMEKYHNSSSKEPGPIFSHKVRRISNFSQEYF